MKKILIFLITLSICFTLFPSNDLRLKPYIMAGYEKGDLSQSVLKIETLLKDNQFEILGKYSPMKDKNRVVIIATHELLKEPIKKIGGLTAFASVIRFGLYLNNNRIEISYMNPIYWGNAYFRKKYPDNESYFLKLKNILLNISKKLNTFKNYQFGSKKGLTVKKLRKYHYMLFMPYFDDVIKLSKNSEYKPVLKKIEENFIKKIGQVEKVYRIDFPEKKLTLFGGALFGKDGESRFIPKIDKYDPKHIAFMPYEFLVMKDKVVMLHGKFRIALSFPDLSMGTFMKIVSTPGNIEDYFADIVKK